MAETASPDLGSGFDTSTFSPPQISLPKGGGALRGIGETFSANGAKGTASFSVPLGLTAARSGFMPQLSLDYDSGGGNGIFGMGWNVSLPAISRRTDKGLPQYRDFEESDIFDLSGAEDLVLAEGGHSEREGYSIRRYRPRVEQAFARIERWTRTCDGETHWRVFSKDNVCALYGTGPESRISDPEAPGHVFTWLLASSFDARGNAILYEYAAENARGVDCSGSQRLRSHDANRHLKRVRYGNRVPLTSETPWSHASWMFSVVLDYGEEDYRNLPPDGEGRIFAHFDSSPHGEPRWPAREDPFSTYRAGFEVRTNRLCRRILMLHHFPEELGTADCMVRSTELEYTPKRTVSLLTRILNSGYERSANGLYLKRSLPPLEFEFSASPLEDPEFDGFELQDAATENLPEGIDGANYRWVDLDGEGIAGVLADHGSGWYYKRNLGRGRFAPAELLYRPSTASLSASGQQLMDVAGDGKMNVVELAPEAGGFYERTTGERWAQFRLFKSFPPLNWDDPNLKFVDITGDGIADILVTEEIAFRWHPSLLHEGFGAERRVPASYDEEEGPRVVFSDPEQSIYLADMTGDGLADIVRIRNGEVCYWPNLGYARFGRKVTMDGAPWFDDPGVFDQQRIRLADTDGSGTADILYIAAAGINIYLNESGNSLSAPRQLRRILTGDIDAITVTDFLGRGTACVLWSSPLPSDSGRPLRYVDLMCGRKPHLLTRIRNNFGSETLLEYASSTEFYLADRAAGRPWVTRLPFPVHVVKRSHVYDFITRNHFVSLKTFHHGYFDGVEREFRGFGCIEQLDTEEFVADESGAFPPADNHAPQWRVPPTLTKTWYHTGILDAGAVSRHLAHEYYREPDESPEMLLDDTILPAGLSSGEAREAARALKGLTLRREVYALDGSPAESPPYSVLENNYLLRMLQPKGANRYAVFLNHSHESLTFNYERKLYDAGGLLRPDPRVSHDVTLTVDDFGNARKVVTVGYGRRFPAQSALLTPQDREKQEQILLVLAENDYTNAVDELGAYRTPMPAGNRKFELYGLRPNARRPGVTNLFRFRELAEKVAQASDGRDLPYEDVPCEPASGPPRRRLFQAARNIYRKNDLTAFLPPGRVESLALMGEFYKLAFTPGLLRDVYRRDDSPLMPDPAAILREGGYRDLDADGNWWMPSGRIFYSSEIGDSAAAELAYARRHFFQPHRYRNQFGNTTTVRYDHHDLTPIETRDSLDNRIESEIDYRVLGPRMVTDANGNRSQAAYDELGMVIGTAVMGKQGERAGDSFDDFPTVSERELVHRMADPLHDPAALLGTATTRLFYDLHAFYRTRKEPRPSPTSTWQLTRETHAADLAPGEQARTQQTFTYSDGILRVIQTKLQSAPSDTGDPQWISTGWTIFDNKGDPVRKYEPFFAASPEYQPGAQHGVASTLLYDPIGRVVATLHPDYTYEKTVFDPWRVETWDANDSVLLDPAADPDVGSFIRRLPPDDYRPTWYQRRRDGELGPAARQAAEQTLLHAATPSVLHLDSLGRKFLSIDWNRTKAGDSVRQEFIASRLTLDIEGQQRAVTDAFGRRTMAYEYDLPGTAIRQRSAEAGERWMLNDVLGKALRVWDNRGFEFRYTYDLLHRPQRFFVRQDAGAERLTEELVYGEDRPDAASWNLRGKTWRHYDTAGIEINEAFDFKANLLRTSRQLLQHHPPTADWAASPPLEPRIFTTANTYDALNRTVTVTTPDGSVTRPRYDEANRLNGMRVTLHEASSESDYVCRIAYNARGQRIVIEYGNGAGTRSEYDPLTFRLTNLKTVRPGDVAVLQDLRYTYDPVGNITAIADRAQETVYFQNQAVSADRDYAYDAIYRLVHANGREMIGRALDTAPTWDGEARSNQPLPGDGHALRRFAEEYEYDLAGNIRAIAHHAGPNGWRREYDYPVENNKLARTRVGQLEEHYHYDAAGHMIRMPHLQHMSWDFNERLQSTSPHPPDQDFERTYYVYDGLGNRVRKISERHGRKAYERIYLGFFELYREYGADGSAEKQRETLHVTDDTRRVAMVETPSGGSPLVRYQFSDPLQSVALELDEMAAIISYEEYYPYGSTSYEAARGGVEVSPKRYRYLGKERDEETGFYFCGARYYACWLGRWISCDPAGLTGGANLYAYSYCCPTCFSDANGRQPNPPQLMRNWTYGVPVPNRAAVGTNVQIDHPVWVSLRTAQRTSPAGVEYYSRSISASEGEMGVLLETGRGLFHTELGPMQRGIRNACVAGIIDGEAETMDLTRQAYSTTSTITGVPVDALSLDTALLSNQATLHVTTGETVQELLAASGPTTMTDDTVNQCFADTFPDPDPVPVDSSMTSATETAVSETVEDSSSLLSSEAKQMSSEEQMMSSEVRMASSEGSLMCEALGTAATGLGAYFAVSGAIDQHEQGDDVGAALSLSTMIAPEVTVPLNGTYQGIKAGAEIMDMKVNCVALCEGYLETLGYVPADDKRAWECASPLLMPPPECIPDPMGP